MKSSKTILTLDAGGTNFVFSAIKDEQQIVEPIRLPAQAHDLDLCLENLVKGFRAVIDEIDDQPDAISFAFPGPADYPNGIIGNLPNFKAFNGGVAMGPMLEDEFGIPVFINNDGDLFAYGEALTGLLPSINQKIAESGNTKRFKNLVGVTTGTGFGGGIVIDGQLLSGDNSCGAEVHNLQNPFNLEWNAEESVSTRAIQRVYASRAGLDFDDTLMPGDIYEIAKGNKVGNQQAAVASFEDFGKALGCSIANALTLIDGIVVIGGGITGAWDLFATAMFEELNRHYKNFRGKVANRLSFDIYNLEDESEAQKFIKGNPKQIQVPGSNRSILHDDTSRVGVGKSKLGASHAVSLGAYAFAVQKLKHQLS
ncbi:MAG: ROK family protein [Balneolaceae bacterium]|nr:ROK family protein [Balneolaceae bacterium]